MISSMVHLNNFIKIQPCANNHQNLQGNPYSVVSLPISSERQLNAPMSSNPDIQQQMVKRESIDPYG